MAPFYSNTTNNSDLAERCQQSCGQRSLYEEVSAYLREGWYPFHMPGHKGNRSEVLTGWNLSVDVTELPGLDNLHDPAGCIAETERRIAGFYNADRSFLLVNGSTAGIIAAICAVCGDGDLLAVDRNCHRSVYSGMILSGARPVYFWPSKGPVPEAKATIVTSPTYEGNVLDIQGIREQSKILIVDEAHGAHFPFHPAFPKGAFTYGADIVVHSFHKTLPAISQSAVVHVKGGKVDIGRLQRALACVQTSSPSYLIMASTDCMLNTLWKEPEHFEKYVERLQKLRQDLSEWLLPNDDISKLLLAVPDGAEWANKHKLAFEMITERYILAMTSVADTPEGFALLKSAMSAMNGLSGGELPAQTSRVKRISPSGAEYRNLALPEVVLTPREAMGRARKKMCLKDAVGEVSGSFLAPFPPGVPVLAPGERIRAGIELKVAADCEIEVLADV